MWVELRDGLKVQGWYLDQRQTQLNNEHYIAWLTQLLQVRQTERQTKNKHKIRQWLDQHTVQ